MGVLLFFGCCGGISAAVVCYGDGFVAFLATPMEPTKRAQHVCLTTLIIGAVHSIHDGGGAGVQQAAILAQQHRHVQFASFPTSIIVENVPLESCYL